MVEVYNGSSPFSFGVSFSPALGVSGMATSCFIGWLVGGGGISVVVGADAGGGEAFAGDAADSSGSADKMCCRELMFATGRGCVGDHGRGRVRLGAAIECDDYRRVGACRHKIMSRVGRKRVI